MRDRLRPGKEIALEVLLPRLLAEPRLVGRFEGSSGRRLRGARAGHEAMRPARVQEEGSADLEEEESEEADAGWPLQGEGE